MKNIYIIVLIVILALLGYFLFIKDSAKTDTEIQDTNNQTASGKLDINVVCESALSYMSFPDGESASKFVAECKEGKYPEVIERYKADMNIGAEVAI